MRYTIKVSEEKITGWFNFYTINVKNETINDLKRFKHPRGRVEFAFLFWIHLKKQHLIQS